jgi:hypothetical protein
MMAPRSRTAAADWCEPAPRVARRTCEPRRRPTANPSGGGRSALSKSAPCRKTNAAIFATWGSQSHAGMPRRWLRPRDRTDATGGTITLRAAFTSDWGGASAVCRLIGRKSIGVWRPSAWSWCDKLPTYKSARLGPIIPLGLLSYNLCLHRTRRRAVAYGIARPLGWRVVVEDGRRAGRRRAFNHYGRPARES